MKKNYLSLFILFTLSAPVVFSQTLRQPLSAIYLNLNAYSKTHSDVFSFVHNQASLVEIKKPVVGIYAEQRFLLQATSVYTTAVVIPTSKGNIGIDLTYSGFNNYNESQVGLAYALPLGKKASIGIQFDHYGYEVPYYSGDGVITTEIGAIIHLTDQLNLGMHVYNPVGGNFSKSNEKLTSTYNVGMGYDASENFFAGAEIIKEESFPVEVNVGIQYRFEKQFFARMGMSSATSISYMVLA
ncbi:MAG: hypothetical protein WDM71_10510 [Ferruginibacter sp.]